MKKPSVSPELQQFMSSLTPEQGNELLHGQGALREDAALQLMPLGPDEDIENASRIHDQMLSDMAKLVAIPWMCKPR